jgi:hypothetical protein
LHHVDEEHEKKCAGGKIAGCDNYALFPLERGRSQHSPLCGTVTTTSMSASQRPHPTKERGKGHTINLG